jgi:aldose sugar dehydrogenase
MSPPRTAYSLVVHKYFTSGAHGLILRGISHNVVFMPPLEYLVAGLVISYCLMILVSVSEDNVALGEPNLKSTEIQLEMIVDGLSRPTGLTFLGPDDILVIEEDTGEVQRVVDGEISQTVLDLDVSTDDSRGLIGIDSYQNGSKTFVFLYYTESSSSSDGEVDPIGNRLYRYELSDDKSSLIN